MEQIDAEHLERVAARMRPFLRDGRILASRIDRVMGTVERGSMEVRQEIVRRLLAAGFVIVDDSVPNGSASGPGTVSSTHTASKIDPYEKASTRVSQPSGPAAAKSAAARSAVAAARRRIAHDRFTRRPEKSLLTAEEEVGLALLIRGKSGDPLPQGGFGKLTGEPRKAAECLFLHNQGLVHSVAQHYAPSGMTYDDIFQHGVQGLIRAVELFDPSMGNKFSTYAMNWVRQAITRGIANESRLIRIPVHMVERISKVWRARGRLTVNGHPPSAHALAVECGLSDDDVVDCLLLGPQDPFSLDQRVGDSESTLGDLLANTAEKADTDDRLMLESLKNDVAGVLETLTEREAEIIRLRHGFGGGDPMTLDEIGSVFGVTRERIRQIEKKVVDRLRDGRLSAVLRPYW